MTLRSMRLAAVLVGMAVLLQASIACAQFLAEEPISPSLEAFIFPGPELHASVRLHPVELLRDLPDGMHLPDNPRVSTDRAFVNATARGGSQGRLDGQGMREALYARYTDGSSEIGFYGLRAASSIDANRREAEIRAIWAHNNALDRAYVYRKDLLLMVVWLWTDDEPPESWAAVNAKVEQRMQMMETE
ncbi:MAG: hypothetical protein AAGE01_11985 [Pseudomonadota bacterium]